MPSFVLPLLDLPFFPEDLEVLEDCELLLLLDFNEVLERPFLVFPFFPCLDLDLAFFGIAAFSSCNGFDSAAW
jgi:hypothetical protein